MGAVKHLLGRVWLTALLLCAGTTSASARQPLIVLDEGKYLHGVYPGSSIGNEDDFSCAMINAYVGSVGRPVAWVYFSNNWFTEDAAVFPRGKVCDIHRLGAVPFIRLMLRPDTDKVKKDGRGPYSSKKFQKYFANLDRINEGKVDALLQRWGRDARDFKYPLIVEFGTEVNDKSHGWNARYNGGPAGADKFKLAFRRVVDQVKNKAGAHNVIWVFHVTAGDSPDESWNRLESYYPDDPARPENDVVDWLGVSVYGAQKPKKEGDDDDNCPEFKPQMDDVYRRLNVMAPEQPGRPAKPIFVLEFGETAGHPYAKRSEPKWQRCKPEVWADAALTAMLKTTSPTDAKNPWWPRLRGFSWWNETWKDDGVVDMQVQHMPLLAERFRHYLTAEPYSLMIVDSPRYMPDFTAPSDDPCLSVPVGAGCAAPAPRP
jgi:hypothetical protein